MRADTLRQTADITRLTEKNAEVERKLNISEAAEASARTQLKSAEAAVRALKDEMARVKTLVSQTRASCATEVRRRDRQIDGLKRQLGEATRSRGAARNPAISVISVTGEVGGTRSNGPESTADAGYNLRDETNEFLTELAKGLSEENEGLLALLRRMREDLRTMSGWERETTAGDGHVVDVTTNMSELESDIAAILEHLRTILTNPSFVPLEEVIVRDEEITHLRDGWVKMESRWKEAVHLIDGWRKRMAGSGMAVNDEELKMSLRLSPVRVRDVAETANAIGLRLPCVKEEEEEEDEKDEDPVGALSPTPADHQDSVDLIPGPPDDLRESDSDASVYDERDELEPEDKEAGKPDFEFLQESGAISEPHPQAIDSSPLPEPPQLSPLKDSQSAGNRGASQEPGQKPRRRTREHSTVVEEEVVREHVEETHETYVAQRRTQSRPVITSQSKRQKVEPVQGDMYSSVSSLDSILLDSPTKRKRPAQRPSQAPPRPRQPTPTRRSEAARSKPVRAEPSPEAAEPATDANRTRSAAAAASPPPMQKQSPRRKTRPSLTEPCDPAPQQSPLTMAAIAAKLAASERDADAARVRAKLKAARMAKRRPELAPPETEAGAPAETGEDVDPVKREVGNNGQEEGEAPVKRKREKRASRVASRRRSTLSPWELESLISGKAVAEEE